MFIIYSLFIQFYAFFLHLASLLGNKRAEKWVKGRKNLLALIETQLSENKSPIIWFHCASLGEFEQARPIIEELKKEASSKKIVITFFSPSGYENQKNYELADYIFYLPIDSKTNAKRIVAAINPEKMIFVKYEFWFNLIAELQKNKIKTYIVSAVFRENQYFFSWYGKSFLTHLKKFNQLYLQDEKSVQQLEKYNFYNYTLAGDTRYDRVNTIASKHFEIPQIKTFKGKGKLLILGSSWQKEEQIVSTYLNEIPEKGNENNLKVVIAPHDISEKHLTEIEQLLQVKSVRFSEYNNNTTAKVLLVDNIGLLSSIYQYGDIAFVGGGFTNELHNILEPATFGMPVIYGNKHKKFPEGAELIKAGGGFDVADSTAFIKKINWLLKDEIVLKMAAFAAKKFIEERLGATKIIMKSVFIGNS